MPFHRRLVQACPFAAFPAAFHRFIPLDVSKARTDTLPPASTLWSLHRPGDFLDCYSVPSTLTLRQAATLGLALPGWAAALLSLRNTLVRPFGLKTGEPDKPIFPTCLETEDELILGTDDKHLNFRIGLIRDQGRIYMSTWVHPHNLWGRAYLRLVMPFHILISRGAVARMATSTLPDR